MDLARLCSSSKERRQRGVFVVEGLKETLRCAESGYRVEEIFFCPDLLDISLVEGLCGNVTAVSRNVYAKLAYRDSTEGVMAVVKERRLALSDIRLSENPLIAVLESVEKPGNLGAVLRTADACSLDAVLVCDPLTDIYNPNVIRASLGGVFTTQVAVCTSEDAIRWLKAGRISIFTAQLQDSLPYYDTDFRGPSAIVMGTEHDGLTDIWRKAADRHIRIPMLGRLDSLNVSVSTAVLCYEALRQRR